MDQVEIDKTITALHDRVSESILAKAIKVADKQIIPLKWASPEPPLPDHKGLDTSRRSIQVQPRTNKEFLSFHVWMTIQLQP
eukprot:4702857-Amphidinium_carterae.1